MSQLKRNFIATREKDPGGTTQFSMDWSSWLPSSETIVSANWTGEGITVVDAAGTISGGVCFVRTTGGVVGVDAFLTCTITTSTSLVEPRTIKIIIKEL